MEIDQSWATWKKTLSVIVNTGELIGFSDETLNKAAFAIGDFLADKIDPANREQKLLAELWSVGSEDERRALASMILKSVDTDGTTTKSHHNH